MDLTDAQWSVVEALLPKPAVREDGRGRPWRDPRDVLNGVLWILRTGAPWADMPSRYPPYATCFRRFQAWVQAGVLKAVLQALAEDLITRGKIDLSETFIDGTHVGAKKGVRLWAELVGGLPPRSWRSQTAVVFLYLPPSLQVNVAKLRSLRTRSTPASPTRSQLGSSETGRTIAKSSKRRSTTKASS